MKFLRWLSALVALAFVVALGLYLSGVLVIERTNGDGRTKGALQHFEALKLRKDVNVLFILTDTLRADHLSAYGYARETSPTMDYMAKTGVRFAHHMAQSSWTKCSMASLWTGLYPQHTGVLRAPHVAPGEALMPAEIFEAAGFRTAGLWRNGWVAPNFGFSQGFEVYERPITMPVKREVRIANPHVKLEGTDYDVVNAANEFLRIHGRERWFLYLHMMDVHQYLYDPSSALFGTSYTDIYDNSVRHTDGAIGQVLTYLAEEGLLQKTLVVLAADHGEAFGERGFEGHAHDVSREETEIPLIIGFPFKLEPGVVIEPRSRNIDIWPTILDMLGLPPLRDADGRSLVPQIEAALSGQPPTMEDVPSIAHLDRGWGRDELPSAPAIAVAKGSFRYVIKLLADSPQTPPVEELYDESTEAGARVDVVESKPEILGELRDVAKRYLESSPPAWAGETETVELDEKEAAELRALGYAQP